MSSTQQLASKSVSASIEIDGLKLNGVKFVTRPTLEELCFAIGFNCRAFPYEFLTVWIWDDLGIRVRGSEQEIWDITFAFTHVDHDTSPRLPFSGVLSVGPERLNGLDDSQRFLASVYGDGSSLGFTPRRWWRTLVAGELNHESRPLTGGESIWIYDIRITTPDAEPSLAFVFGRAKSIEPATSPASVAATLPAKAHTGAAPHSLDRLADKVGEVAKKLEAIHTQQTQAGSSWRVIKTETVKGFTRGFWKWFFTQGGWWKLVLGMIVLKIVLVLNGIPSTDN